MLKKILLYFGFLFPFYLSAQTIEITSVKKAEEELEITYRKKHFPNSDIVMDKNGNPCALIKIIRADNMPKEILKRIVAEGYGQFLNPQYIENEGLYFYISYNMDKIKVYDADNRTKHQSDYFNLKKCFEYNSQTGSKGLNPYAVYNMTLKYTGGSPISKIRNIKITTTPADATIYINNEKMDKKGQVELGMQANFMTYKVERKGYYTQEKTIELNKNISEHITLTPICGTLHVASNPTGAQVLLNGRVCGLTPLDTVLQIGDYQLVLTKPNAKVSRQTVRIEEKKHHNINEKLQTSDFVNIHSKPDKAVVYINRKRVGETPLQYEMNFGQTYIVEAEKYGGRRSKEIHFHENYHSDIMFEIDPALNVSPSSHTFPAEASAITFDVSTPFDNWRVHTTDKWLSITEQSSESFTVQTSKNRKYSSRGGTVTVSVANKKEKIRLTQVGKFRKNTDGFSDFFLEYVGGYQMTAKQHTVGLNFSYLGEGAGGHLGFYLNPNYGFDNTFIGAAGAVTRWTHHERAIDEYNSFDLQFYFGAAYKTDFTTTTATILDNIGADVGIRLTGTDPMGSRFGFYSATLGAKVFKNEIIPSIGLSTGMFGSALIFRNGRINDRDDFQSWFLEAIGGYGLGTDSDFWGAGATLAFVPTSMGGYVTGMYGDGYAVTGGLVFRVIPNDLLCPFDLQVYGGAGYNSSVSQGLVFDAGLRLTGAYDQWGDNFSKLSATIGTMVSPDGQWIPTIGISLGLSIDILYYVGLGGWLWSLL